MESLRSSIVGLQADLRYRKSVQLKEGIATLTLSTIFVNVTLGIIMAYQMLALLKMLFSLCLFSDVYRAVKDDSGQSTAISTAVLILVHIVGRPTYRYLAQFKYDGGAVRTFRQDVTGFAAATFPLLVMWAYKEWMWQIVPYLFDKPIHEKYGAFVDGDRAGDLILYELKVIAFTLACTMGFVVMYRIADYVENALIGITDAGRISLIPDDTAMASRDDFSAMEPEMYRDTGGHFMDRMQFALAVSVGWYHVSLSSVYWVPFSWVRHPEETDTDHLATTVVTIGWFFSCVVYTKFVSAIMAYSKGRRMPSDPSLLRLLSEDMLDLTVKSLPYVLVWAWAQFGFQLVYGQIFGCIPASPANTACHDPYNILAISVGYAIVITWLAVNKIPKLNQSVIWTGRNTEKFARNLLRSDAWRMSETQSLNELLIKVLSFVIGVSWNVAAEDFCDVKALSTCPASASIHGLLVFFVTIGLIGLVLSWIHHRFCESARFFRRMNKVTQIEAGDGEAVFESLDKDKDGNISYRELTWFLQYEGLDSPLFMKAFDKLDNRDGSRDGHVNGSALIETFEQLANDISGHEVHDLEAMLCERTSLVRTHSFKIAERYVSGETFGIKEVHEACQEEKPVLSKKDSFNYGSVAAGVVVNKGSTRATAPTSSSSPPSSMSAQAKIAWRYVKGHAFGHKDTPKPELAVSVLADL